MKSLAALIIVLLVAGCVGDAEQTENKTLPIENISVVDNGTQNQTTEQQNITTQNKTERVAEEQKPTLFDFKNVTTESGGLIVHYFHSSGCVASIALNPEIDKLEKNYPDVLFARYDIFTQNGTQAYLAFADQYNLSRDLRLVPQVLVNGTIITDRFNINDSLEGMIQGFE
jgi:thiol-disulfide isomerase/thioredoxin